MDRNRLIMALALSLVVLMSWPLIMRYLAPPPPLEEPFQIPEEPLKRATENPKQAPVPTTRKVIPPAPTAARPQAQAQITQVAQRDITISFEDQGRPYWHAKLSNRGAVATSWILERYKENGVERVITGSDNNPLQLIPQPIPEPLDAPLSLRTPWSPEIALQLNRVNFQVEGVAPDETTVTLGPDDTRKITFTYTSPTITATKSFTFHGGSFVFGVTAEVKSGGSSQPVEIILGPRFGDQSDRQTGSYSTPPQVIAYTREGKRQQILGAAITPPFATITTIDHDSNQIELDKPLADGVTQIKLTADKGA